MLVGDTRIVFDAGTGLRVLGERLIAAGIVPSVTIEKCWHLVGRGNVVGATLVLVKHMPTVSRLVDQATAAGAEPGRVQTPLLVHAAAGLVVLLAITTLSIYQPWGPTASGRRKQLEERGFNA